MGPFDHIPARLELARVASEMAETICPDAGEVQQAKGLLTTVDIAITRVRLITGVRAGANSAWPSRTRRWRVCGNDLLTQRLPNRGSVCLPREKDQAFAWLERAYRQRDASLPGVKADALLENLRSNPRWKRSARDLPGGFIIQMSRVVSGRRGKKPGEASS